MTALFSTRSSCTAESSRCPRWRSPAAYQRLRPLAARLDVRCPAVARMAPRFRGLRFACARRARPVHRSPFQRTRACPRDRRRSRRPSVQWTSGSPCLPTGTQGREVEIGDGLVCRCACATSLEIDKKLIQDACSPVHRELARTLQPSIHQANGIC